MCGWNVDIRPVITYDVMNRLFEYYRLGNRTTYLTKIVEDEIEISPREAVLIWQAFDRAAEQWEPRIAGM